jgi:hypothetical protein
MTITSTTNKTIVSCNGVTSIFTYNFLLPAGALFSLYQLTVATGVIALISTANYSVSGIGQPAGGTFTYLPGGTPVATGNELIFVRQVPETQQTSLINQGGYNPSVVEPAMDWIVEQIQDLREIVNRCIKFPVVDGVTALDLVPQLQRENLALKFDGSGQPYAG